MGLVTDRERGKLCQAEGAEDDADGTHGAKARRAMAIEDRDEPLPVHGALRCAPRDSRASSRNRCPRYQRTTRAPATSALVPMRSATDGSLIAARMSAPRPLAAPEEAGS